jgi:hypothetical protein
MKWRHGIESIGSGSKDMRANPENERGDQLAREEVVKIRRHQSPEKLVEFREIFIASRDPNSIQGSLL